jgi:hypothetical protein
MSVSVFPSIALVQAEMIAQINAPHFRIVAQIRGAALTEYLATFQDIRAIRHAQRFPDVMIRDQDTDSGLGQIADDLLEILNG